MKPPFTTTTASGAGLTLTDFQRAFDAIPKPPWAAFLGVSVELRQTKYAPDDAWFVLDLRSAERDVPWRPSGPDYTVVIRPQVFAKLPVELTLRPRREMLAIMLWMTDEAHKRKQAARRPEEPPIRIIKEGHPPPVRRCPGCSTPTCRDCFDYD